MSNRKDRALKLLFFHAVLSVGMILAFCVGAWYGSKSNELGRQPFDLERILEFSVFGVASTDYRRVK